MTFALSSFITENISPILIEALNKHYIDRNYIFTDLKVFYRWCKKECDIEILCKYLLPNTYFSLDIRTGITSYLLGTHCPPDRMSEDERRTVLSFRDQQKEERKLLTNKRLRDYKDLEREADNIKKIKLSIIDNVSKEQCIPIQNNTSILCLDNLLVCFKYLDLSTIWNIRRVCRCFYNAYSMCDSPIVFHTLTDESIRINTLILSYYAVDTTLFTDKKQAGEILTYVRKNYSSVRQFKEDNKDTLSSSKMKSILSAVTPIYHYFKDRIIIDTLTIVLGVVTHPVTYTPLVNTFLLSVFDISHINGGIIMETNQLNICNSSYINDILSRAVKISWIKFRFHTSLFIHLLTSMHIKAIVLPQVESIVIHHPKLVNDSVLHDYIIDLLPIINMQVCACFPNLQSITFINSPYRLPSKIGNIPVYAEEVDVQTVYHIKDNKLFIEQCIAMLENNDFEL